MEEREEFWGAVYATKVEFQHLTARAVFKELISL